MGHLKPTTSGIIQRFREIHKDKYIYDKVEYKYYNEKVVIGCYIHGDFEQTVSNHLSGYGCVGCKVDYLANLRRLTTETFIEKANKTINDLKQQLSGKSS